MMPSWVHTLEQYNVVNPYKSMSDGENVYLLCGAEGNINATLGYIQRHYAENAKDCCVKIIENGCTVHRILIDSPDLPVEQAVSGNDKLKYSYNVIIEKDKTTTYGYVYGEDINSYNANIYMEAQLKSGERRIYCAQQSKADFTDDIMNGAYSQFTCTVEETVIEEITAIYLETDDCLYRVTKPMISLNYKRDSNSILIQFCTEAGRFAAVDFPCWGMDGDTDDNIWHLALEVEPGIWRYEIDLSEHDGSSSVQVHCHGFNKNGEFMFIDGFNIEVNSLKGNDDGL